MKVDTKIFIFLMQISGKLSNDNIDITYVIVDQLIHSLTDRPGKDIEDANGHSEARCSFQISCHRTLAIAAPCKSGFLMDKKKHICHLTVLNPARHSRIFYKEARSQVAAGYRVSIIGQDPAPAPYVEEGIQIVPSGIFSRLSFKRFTARRTIISLASRPQADLYQIHAPELLAPARRLLKSVPGCRLVYDMHEDYALNIREGGYYPGWIKDQLATVVRKKERDFAHYGHGLIEAEACFRGIIDFPSEQSALVRNKYLPPGHIVEAPGFGNPELPLLVSTGTIAENWGTIKAVQLWIRLQGLLPSRLALVGHTHDQGLLDQIRKMVEQSGFSDRFLLVGGENYVPYESMAGWIASADAGLALYRLLPNIRDRIPTRFYEFMAAGVPTIHSINPAWDSVFKPGELSLPISNSPSAEELAQIASLLKTQKDRKAAIHSPQAAWSWKTEEKSMLELLEKVFSLPE